MFKLIYGQYRKPTSTRDRISNPFPFQIPQISDKALYIYLPQEWVIGLKFPGSVQFSTFSPQLDSQLFFQGMLRNLSKNQCCSGTKLACACMLHTVSRCIRYHFPPSLAHRSRTSKVACHRFVHSEVPPKSRIQISSASASSRKLLLPSAGGSLLEQA